MPCGTLEEYCSEEQIKRLQKLAVEEPVVDLGTDCKQEDTGKCLAMMTTDPMCDYICGSKGAVEDLQRIQDNCKLISTEQVDYNICKAQKDHTETILDKRDSLSYMSVRSVEEGIDWYRNNFPKVPEELLEPMARWNFGNLSQITKKDVKNDNKRIKQGKKPKVMKCLEVKTGNFVVEF